MYKILLDHLGTNCPPIYKWCLDFPKHQSGVLVSDLKDDGLLFQGWVLAGNVQEVHPFVQVNGEKHLFDLNVNRPDVISRVLSEDPADHPLLKCGFRFRLPLESAEAFFGFRVGGEDFTFARLSVESELKVLEGEEGWLFLDNDTNRSVDQFTGQWLLSRDDRSHWSDYLEDFSRMAARGGAQHAVLIVPAKEMVLSRYYPHKKGKSTPVEQVLALARKHHRLIYPVATLQNSEERSYRLMDTHWTPHGAMLTVLDVLATLGLDPGEARQLFAGDTYREREVTGDLGNKFYPPRTAVEKLLVSFGYQKKVVFDNNLPNLGRVIVIHNPEALHPKKCLIFGSSSSFSMLAYLARVFTDLVFVHSAGNIDASLWEFEAPDYVLAQTNGRFVVRPPVVGYHLRDEVAAKLAAMPETERAAVLQKAEEFVRKRDDERIRFYRDMLAQPAHAS